MDKQLQINELNGILNARLANLSENKQLFTMLLSAKPYVLDQNEYQKYNKRYLVIKEFLSVVNSLIYETLCEDKHPELYRLIFFGKDNEYINEQRRWYQNNPGYLPIFFRTDEPIPGVIAEIQCPGSGLAQLGELEQAWNTLLDKKLWPSWSKRVAKDIKDICGHEEPRLIYMPKSSCIEDSILFYNALKKQGIRFINQLADGSAYKNKIDMGILSQIDMIKIHSHGFFRSWPAFWQAVDLAKEKRLIIDVPPALIFNMKLSMALPFHPDYQNRFSDNVRGLFPYTSIVLKNGLIRHEGKDIKYDEYLRLPDKQRRHIIKSSSGTSDLDDGGKGVFSLARTTRTKCANIFKKAELEFHYGERWIIQEEMNQQLDYSYLKEGLIVNDSGYARFSGFYGPSGLLSIRALFKNFYKVGGSATTVCAPVLINDKNAK